MSVQTSFIDQLPVIDLAGLRTVAPGAISSIAKAVRDACRTMGFFYIVNHGIPDDLQQHVLAEAGRLFDLSNQQKKSLDIKKSKHMRGYFGYGADKSDGVNGDIKEGFDLALDLPAADALVQAGLPFYGPNVWPESLPNFRRNLTAYYDQMLQLGSDLLRAFGIGLGVSENYFEEYFTNPMAQLRLLRYPPRLRKKIPRIGAGEHTDFGWITIILQGKIDGLEIKDADGHWLSVPGIPGSLVVNIGDLMQRWTNDAYKATVHRVINRAGTARYSAAFFMDPNYHAIVECLPSCVSAKRPPNYAPIVAGDYMQERFRQTTTFQQNQQAA